jgi:hypothetical protein
LIGKGAEVNTVNIWGKTALDLASDQNIPCWKTFADDEAKNLYLASKKEIEQFLMSIRK